MNYKIIDVTPDGMERYIGEDDTDATVILWMRDDVKRSKIIAALERVTRAIRKGKKIPKRKVL